MNFAVCVSYAEENQFWSEMMDDGFGSVVRQVHKNVHFLSFSAAALSVMCANDLEISVETVTDELDLGILQRSEGIYVLTQVGRISLVIDITTIHQARIVVIRWVMG